MDNIQVKLVDFEEKSVQEIEQKLLDEHEQKMAEPVETVVETPTDEPIVESPQFGDNDVLSYLKTKFNKEVNSLDELFVEKPQPQQELLPEDVNAFLKFKKETGRGLEDFYRVNQDYSKVNPERLLADYMREINPDFDDEDIAFEYESKFGYDEDMDEEKDIKRKKLALKKELGKASKYFEEQKEKYKAPLESRMETSIPEEYKVAYDTYKQYVDQTATFQQEASKKSEYFMNKTNELFSDEFKGFDFKVGDKEISYKPNTPEQLKAQQTDISKFFNNFVDENGYIKDAKQYHKTVAAAMNPDAMAKFFYDMGKADAIDDSVRQSKNIDMSVRNAPQNIDKGGFKVTALDSDHGNRLKIKSLKN
ncbi:MAG: Cellulophaga phage phi19:3 [Bacteroidota bacterium]|jgi:hypothetical protein